MTDVAQLGLAVSSDQVTSATAALNKFSSASQSAQTATEKLMAATGRSESSVRSIQAAAARSGTTFDEMAKRVDANTAAHNKLVTASQAAAKGITNLSAGAKSAANDNGTFQKSTEASNSSLEKLANTLTRRVLFAFAAKEVRDLAAYVWQLNSAIAATADAAQRSAIGGGNFQGLQTSAAYKGVSNNDFNGAMVAFNQQLDLAKNGLGDLKTLLNANGKTVADTATTFGVVADLVKNAGSEAQKFSILRQAGLPTESSFVRYMEQGSAAIKAQGDAASKLSAQQLIDAQRINDKWQEGWTNFEGWGKKAVVNIFEFMGSTLPAWFKTQAENTYSLPKPNAQGRDWLGVAAPAGTVTSAPLAPIAPTKPTANPNDIKAQNALTQQTISLLGPLATVEETVRAKELEISTARLNNVKITQDQANAILLVTRAQAELNKVNQQAAIGVFDLAKAQKAVNDNLQSQVAQHLLDPKNAEQWAAATTAAAKSLENLSQQAKVAGAPLEGLQRLANEAGSARTQLDQFATTSLNAVSPAIQDMLNGTTSLSDGFKNLGMTIVKAAEDAVIKLVLIKPIIDALQTSLNAGGLLGFLGLGGKAAGAGSGIVLGGAGGPGQFVPSANGNVFSGGNVIPFARGGVFDKPTMAPMALFGEAGPEAIIPLTRGPGGKLGIQSHGGGQGGSMGDVHMGDTHLVIQGSVDSEDRFQRVVAEIARIKQDQVRQVKQFVASQRYAQTGVS